MTTQPDARLPEDPGQPGGLPQRPDPGRIAQRTYRHLRVAMVALLVALAVSVAHQSVRQGGLLESVSAYYYTPAQAVFVGVLVGLGVAMVALRGTSDVEDVLLDLGGMLAPVVAVVPTSRGEDFRAAVAACRAADAPVHAGRTALDCPTVRSLVAATRANVENNMTALFVAGFLALGATAVFALVERRGRARRSAGPGRTLVRGYVVAVLVYSLALAAFLGPTGWFVDHAHYYAAVGLFLAIVAVVVANGVRRSREQLPRATWSEAVRSRPSRGYVALAAVMVGTAVAVGALVALGVVTLFWLEAALVGLFTVFWVVQTWEQWDAA